MSVTVLLTSILLAGFAPIGYTTPTKTTFNPVGSITALPCGKTDFERGWMGFTQDVRDSFDWSLGSGPTPTGKTKNTRITGPPNDHTFGSTTGKYVFMNAKSRKQGDNASLHTPVYRTPPNSVSGISFFYHMYGSGMGTLIVELVTATQSSTIFTKNGNQRNAWRKAVIHLPNLSSEQWFQIRFNAKVGKNKRSDIALDDIDFFYGPCASCIGNLTSESGLEGWTQNMSDDFNWTFDGRSFLYIKANNRQTGSKAVITSPIFDRPYSDLCNMKFRYIMSGKEIGSLNISIATLAGYKVVWEKSGHQGNRWMKAVVPLQAATLKLPFQISFTGIRGKGNTGHIIIDNIFFSDKCCPGSKFLQSSCLNANQTICESNLTWSKASCSSNNWCDNQLSCNRYLINQTKTLQQNCYCKHGFTGPQCQTCSTGYTGRQCETDINECSSNPCRTSSSCVDSVGSYSCKCARGFTGQLCETDIDDCATQPCWKNSQCTDGVNQYTCQCATGFTGQGCETNIDDCEHQPCHNNRKCEDRVNGTHCEITTSNQQASSSLTQLQMIAIVALAVVVFAIVLVVAVVFAVMKRRKQKEQQPHGAYETSTVDGHERSGHSRRTARTGKKQSKRCGRTLLERSNDGHSNAAIGLPNGNQYEDVQCQPGSVATCCHSDKAVTDGYEVPLREDCNASQHAKVSNVSTIESSFSNVLSKDPHEEHPDAHIESSFSDSVSSTLRHSSKTSLDVYENIHPPHVTALQHNNESPQSNGSPRTHSQSEMSLDIYENAHPHQSNAYSPTSSAMQGPDDASIYNTLQHNSSPHQSNGMPKAPPHSQTSPADYENVHLRSLSPSGSQAPIDDSIYSTLQHDSVAQQANAGTCSTVCDEIYDNPLPLPQGGHSQAVSSDKIPPTGHGDI